MLRARRWRVGVLRVGAACDCSGALLLCALPPHPLSHNTSSLIDAVMHSTADGCFMLTRCLYVAFSLHLILIRCAQAWASASQSAQCSRRTSFTPSPLPSCSVRCGGPPRTTTSSCLRRIGSSDRRRTMRPFVARPPRWMTASPRIFTLHKALISPCKTLHRGSWRSVLRGEARWRECGCNTRRAWMI